MRTGPAHVTVAELAWQSTDQQRRLKPDNVLTVTGQWKLAHWSYRAPHTTHHTPHTTHHTSHTILHSTHTSNVNTDTTQHKQHKIHITHHTPHNTQQTPQGWYCPHHNIVRSVDGDRTLDMGTLVISRTTHHTPHTTHHTPHTTQHSTYTSYANTKYTPYTTHYTPHSTGMALPFPPHRQWAVLLCERSRSRQGREVAR
jgi:hypothetical protein